MAKNPPVNAADGRDTVRSLCWEDHLEEEEAHKRVSQAREMAHSVPGCCVGATSPHTREWPSRETVGKTE